MICARPLLTGSVMVGIHVSMRLAGGDRGVKDDPKHLKQAMNINCAKHTSTQSLERIENKPRHM